MIRKECTKWSRRDTVVLAHDALDSSSGHVVLYFSSTYMG